MTGGSRSRKARINVVIRVIMKIIKSLELRQIFKTKKEYETEVMKSKTGLDNCKDCAWSVFYCSGENVK